MKVDRHAKIVELIGKYEIETQEELAEYLTKAGYQVNPGYCVQGYPGAEAVQGPGRKRKAAVRGVPEPGRLK